MKLTNHAKFMHCLPVRRNVVVTDEVIDSANSLVIEQANNRTYAVQLVLQKILRPRAPKGKLKQKKSKKINNEDPIRKLQYSNLGSLSFGRAGVV
jgi:N-succinyl-L-ornithine transcarbamylase